MEKAHGHNNRYGMVIDLDKCTGCGTCAIACAAENNVSVREDESDKTRFISWMHIFKVTNGKPFPFSPRRRSPRLPARLPKRP